MTSRNKTHYTSEIYTLLDAGKYKEASQRAKILCEQYPDDIECTFLLSAALLNNKKYEKARKVILHGIERFPKEWRLHMLLGNVYGFLNKLSDAEKEYRRALAEAKRGSKADIAELHCSIAESLWAQSARESALIEW
jgi:Flp pilus assembly protein TadD